MVDYVEIGSDSSNSHEQQETSQLNDLAAQAVDPAQNCKTEEKEDIQEAGINSFTPFKKGKDSVQKVFRQASLSLRKFSDVRSDHTNALGSQSVAKATRPKIPILNIRGSVAMKDPETSRSYDNNIQVSSVPKG